MLWGPRADLLFSQHPEPDEAPTRGMSSSQSSLGRRKRGPASSKSKSSKSKSTPNTTITKSTGPYDRAFQQHLIDFGVYPDRYEYPDGRCPSRPENIDEIRQVLAQRRESLSPSRFQEKEFEKFQRADAHATKERQVTTSVIPLVQGDVGDSKCVSGEIPFTNLDHLTDGSLVPGNPDLYYGARPAQLDPQVRAELGGHIIPSTQPDLPLAPNFFLAVKGPDGSLAVASRQACYDGALGTRGVHSLRSYVAGASALDNKAYVITSLYHGGTLRMYTCHPTQPSPGARLEYVMTQINSWSLTGNAEAFRQGVGAYRNGMDWTKAQRDDAIRQANEKVTNRASKSRGLTRSSATEASADTAQHPSQHTLSPVVHPNAPPPPCDLDTSADEDGPSIKRSKRSAEPPKQQHTARSTDLGPTPP